MCISVERYCGVRDSWRYPNGKRCMNIAPLSIGIAVCVAVPAIPWGMYTDAVDVPYVRSSGRVLHEPHYICELTRSVLRVSAFHFICWTPFWFFTFVPPVIDYFELDYDDSLSCHEKEWDCQVRDCGEGGKTNVLEDEIKRNFECLDIFRVMNARLVANLLPYVNSSGVLQVFY
ncbi:unnamed protein product [Gongylonema pulchrum]|uniref:Anoctamin n=1 Tax=Gongylonema pulchrum TaxID=637853 RepID=A0A183E3L1_9BILA|nr:unnamed protein product [Gongylonema pulchrum]